eukprot:764477-Hanusia_phi.AAC.2
MARRFECRCRLVGSALTQDSCTSRVMVAAAAPLTQTGSANQRALSLRKDDRIADCASLLRILR